MKNAFVERTRPDQTRPNQYREVTRCMTSDEKRERIVNTRMKPRSKDPKSDRMVVGAMTRDTIADWDSMTHTYHVYRFLFLLLSGLP